MFGLTLKAFLNFLTEVQDLYRSIFLTGWIRVCEPFGGLPSLKFVTIKTA